MKKASRAHPERGRTALRRVVLPGFEPGQAEPKTAVLPLHHKTILSIRKPSESAERSQRLCISDCKINAIFSHNQILCKNFSFSLQSWGDEEEGWEVGYNTSQAYFITLEQDGNILEFSYDLVDYFEGYIDSKNNKLKK